MMTDSSNPVGDISELPFLGGQHRHIHAFAGIPAEKARFDGWGDSVARITFRYNFFIFFAPA